MYAIVLCEFIKPLGTLCSFMCRLKIKLFKQTTSDKVISLNFQFKAKILVQTLD